MKSPYIPTLSKNSESPPTPARIKRGVCCSKYSSTDIPTQARESESFYRVHADTQIGVTRKAVRDARA